MITDITLYFILASVALALIIAMSTGASMYLRGKNSQDPNLVKKMSVYVKTTAFILFLVIGFSVVPIMVKLLTDAFPSVIAAPALTQFLQGNAIYIVYGFWCVYAAGLAIAFPAMKKSGFFAPELPENFQTPPYQKKPAAALPPLDYQINVASLVLLATTETGDGGLTFRIREIWKQTSPADLFAINTIVTMETKIFEMLGYKPQDGQDVIFFFSQEGLPSKNPLELLPVLEGEIIYGPTDPTVMQKLTVEDLKRKVTESLIH